MNSKPDDVRRSQANMQAKINLLLGLNALANLHLRDGARTLQAERTYFRDQVAMLNAQRDMILASRSWKLTAPLRWLQARIGK